MSDLGIEVLPPDRYDGRVEKVRYSFTAVTRITITYRLDTPDGIRRVDDNFLISAPPSSASHYRTAHGLGRVEDILRIRGLTLADAEAAGGLKSLPNLLEGVALAIVTQNQRTAGFDCPVVVRVEKP